MTAPSDRHVDITENGRSGSVVYREPAGSLAFYWEFGGGDVVVIIQVSDDSAWKSAPTWLAGRKAEVLRFVADETIRQKAPSCRAEINEVTGEILLRQVGPAPIHVPPDVAFVRRFSSAKAILGIIVLVVALIFGGVMWLGKKVLSVASASGVPLGECVRTDAHIATLLQATDPHLPEITGRGGNTTTSISVLVIPLDGSEPKKVVVAEGLTPNQYALAKILGSDGSTLWFDVNGIGGVDLKTYELLKPGEVRDPYVPKSAWPFAISPDTYFSAGLIAAPGRWYGLHSAEETQGEFATKKFLRRVVRQVEAKQLRRFHRGELDAPVDDKYHRILSMTPINDNEYLNAAFLRMDDVSEPLPMSEPDGALMIYTSEPGLKGRLMVARVDTAGTILWKVDTGIDRFKLSQILPGKDSFAFVGTRPPVPDKLSEPLLVIVENRTGAVVTHSLWQ